MPKAYFMVQYRSSSDNDERRAYTKLAVEAINAAGGRFLAHGGRVLAKEQAIQERAVIVEFDNYDLAVATYGGEPYKKALAALPEGIVRDFRIVEGVD
jgi:uncharacterized protein (DUF1330 family)